MKFLNGGFIVKNKNLILSFVLTVSCLSSMRAGFFDVLKRSNDWCSQKYKVATSLSADMHSRWVALTPAQQNLESFLGGAATCAVVARLRRGKRVVFKKPGEYIINLKR